jgi:hypothetical protein
MMNNDECGMMNDELMSSKFQVAGSKLRTRAFKL